MCISITCDCCKCWTSAAKPTIYARITSPCCGKCWRTSRRFLGSGQFGYVLSQIGIDDPNEVADIINTLSHKKVYYYESDQPGP